MSCNISSNEFNNFREIKTYVKRIGRMTDSQKRNYEELSKIWCIPYSKNIINFSDIFSNNNPVVIEIGFGMGSATAKIAEENKNINYIGIEVHKPGVGKLLGEIQSRNLQNIRIIEYDALTVIEDMIANNSVFAFHIFFPDPWQKKRHHKRRLVQRPRTNILSSKLISSGYLYMVTDWSEYADFAMNELSETSNLVNKYNGFAEKQTWRPETKFEMKGIKKEHDIRELYFIKQ